MSQKIKKLSDHDSIDKVKTKSGLVIPGAMADADAEVAAKGTTLNTAKGNLVTKETASATAQLAAQTATTNLHNQKETTIKAFNSLADKEMEKHPDDHDAWEAMGFQLTKDPAAKEKPHKPDGGGASQSDFGGQADLHCNSLHEESEFYNWEETTGDPTVENGWYETNPPETTASKATVEVKTKNVVVWFRVRGNNAAGAGPYSDPFGGFPIH